MEQVKAIRHDETRKLQGKFEGEPTYTGMDLKSKFDQPFYR